MSAEIKRFFAEEDAVSTVEIILILVVLIALVVIFKEQLTSRNGGTSIKSLT